MILLDTDHLSILTNARAAAHGVLLERIEAAATENFGIPVVAAEEQCRGWLAEIARLRAPDKQVHAYDRLAKLFDFLGAWDIVRFDVRAAEEWVHSLKVAMHMVLDLATPQPFVAGAA